MNTEYFIAKRIFSEKSNRKKLSLRIVNIAVYGITLGLAVMIISVAVLLGFKKEIRDKVTGFGSHIQLVNYDSNQSYETQPVENNQEFIPEIKQLEGVAYIQEFATKPGIIKANEVNHGIVLKGVGKDFDWKFFNTNLQEGSIIKWDESKASNDIIISRKIADLLDLKLNDPVYAYFFNKNSLYPLSRKFKVTGIYNTSLEDFDSFMVLADIRQIQKLNKWDSNQISGYEVAIKNFNNIEDITWQISLILNRYIKEDSTSFMAENILQKFPQIFDWLSLLDMNVWVILLLITLVAGINMISGLLILILEKTPMIGILKALGTRNYSVRKVFLYLSALLISRGLLWGNIIGIAFCILQSQFNIISLDPTTYYLDTVPVFIQIQHIILLNIGTMVCTVAMLLIPSLFIARITPDKAIRFE
ncbi:ABC transporter permease [Puteibacter caeruleilacunae]|nr:ABC transporter permease [Puteibacter caeruleilacunae]